MKTNRLTVAQATIAFLQNQFVERDGISNRFFAGCFGIFGHGIVAGIGQALQQYPELRYFQVRNEQAMVHAAAAYAKVKNRLSAFVCTSSIGPGATNMITGAAAATINRLPVLLLPGDIFAKRNVAPVLQQLEWSHAQDVSVNDCFKPVSKYWDRINRPEQLITSLPEAMRILTSQADTGAVTLSMPQDVQAEAHDFPVELFKKRIWQVTRPEADRELLAKAAGWIIKSKKPLIIAGGGVIYSGAEKILKQFVNLTGIPVAETFAGKGSLHYNDPHNLGAVGVTGTPGAIAMAREADMVIGIGTRYSDFTTISKSAFQHPYVRFININITEFDAFKHAALPLVGDARVILENLKRRLKGYTAPASHTRKAHNYNISWDKTVEKIYHLDHGVPVSQGEVIGAVNEFSGENDIMVSAAGSMPGDLHKLWRTRSTKGFHLEYGYSTMGYEIAGGLGAKMASPDSEVYVMVGDGSYLMLAQEIITSIQEGYKLTIILLDNHGFASIGSLSSSLGSKGFGTYYKFRNKKTKQLDGAVLPVDLAANAASMGAYVIRVEDIKAFRSALTEAKSVDHTTVIYIEVDRNQQVDGYAWWEVAVAEVSKIKSVKKAFHAYQKNKKKQKPYL